MPPDLTYLNLKSEDDDGCWAEDTTITPISTVMLASDMLAATRPGIESLLT
jgi:hypothetical protein